MELLQEIMVEIEEIIAILLKTMIALASNSKSTQVNIFYQIRKSKLKIIITIF